MPAVTVAEVNKTFATKGLYITLPLADDVIVTAIDIMERVKTPGNIKLLMRVKFLNDKGRETQDIFVCEGKTEIEKKYVKKAYELPKKSLLPRRTGIAFDSDTDATEFLKQAISHLLMDKGYAAGENPACDVYFEKDGKGFFMNLALRLDDATLERAKALVELRRSLREKAGNHDFALIVPAIQEPLGLPLRLQERWVSRNQDYLAVQRIGVFGVDNQDPNTIYPFTIYPSMLDLKRYFMVTSQQWSMVRSRYVLERAKKERGDAPAVSFAEIAGGMSGMGMGGMPDMPGMGVMHGGTTAPGVTPLPPPPPPPPLPNA
ncbi:MAG: hypothetical protein Q7T05_07755 [Dehalococcoidia bacterium]|nr:hypothetical protein [Dehalococcoidia bacterium]